MTNEVRPVGVTGPRIGTGWWRFGSFYQIYPWSFADASGDGIGDLAGIRRSLRYLLTLGIDAVWMSPWFDSPMVDGGYDVADYFDVHPSLGTIAELEQLIAEFADAGIGVLFDLVANHTSDLHPWFREAVAAGPGTAERQRYHFHPPTADDKPPNDWKGDFGGSAWTRVSDGEWYLHTFDRSQPDLNWESLAVRDFFDEVIEFWVEKGVAGFRADVAHGLAKDDTYPSMTETRLNGWTHPYVDRDEVHAHVRRWRSVVDRLDRDLVTVAEVVVPTWDRLARYLRPDEYHQVFNPFFIKARWREDDMRRVIASAIEATASVGAVPTWSLSNHDEVRHATRYGLPATLEPADWLLHGARSLVDDALGQRRARAAALLTLALPGSHYMFQGEELGLPEAYDLPTDSLRDPTWGRSGHQRKGRDGCRVPIPWTVTPPTFGFTAGSPWLPIPQDWAELAVESQEADPQSTLTLYRSALQIRRRHLRHSEFQWLDGLGLSFQRGEVMCLVNFGPQHIDLPPGELLIASEVLDGGRLPPDAGAWVLTGRATGDSRA